MRWVAFRVLAGLVLVAAAASTQAMTPGTFGVAWADINSFTYNIYYGNQWHNGVSANNGTATATFDPTGADPVKNLGRVWCVDLFNYTGTTDSYYAENWTDADGAASDYAWINPVGDGDNYRSPAGLGQAAWLANSWGAQVSTLGERRALQMAIWQAAYGSSFQYVSGGGIDTTKYAEFLGYIAEGRTSTVYSWYDNNQTGDHYQDFIDDVPEPCTLLLLGGGLFGAAGLVWRRRREV
jgi:hypothetical protein